MAPEGMVHALELIHALLRPGGCLVDIHPSGEPPAFEVWLDGTDVPAGLLRETDDFVEYGQAGAALAAVVARGLFAVEQSSTFTFLTHADSPEALRAFLEAEWSDAVLDDEVFRRMAAAWARPAATREAVLREPVTIARLRRRD